MSNRWTIFIVPKAGGGVAFLPDVDSASEGDPLQAEIDDLVSWTNRTDKDVALEANPAVQGFDRKIAAGDASSFFRIRKLNVTYRCVNPAQDHEIIQASEPLIS